MKQFSPYKVFGMATIVLLIVGVLMYVWLPTYHYYKGLWLVYKPHSSLPELSSTETVTNMYVLVKLSSFVLTYWMIVTFFYFILGIRKRFNPGKSLTLVHFWLAASGSVLLVGFNKFIINPDDPPHYLDIFVSGQFTKEQTLMANQLMLFYDSLQTDTSIIGIILIVLSVPVFVLNVLRGLDRHGNQCFGDKDN